MPLNKETKSNLKEKIPYHQILKKQTNEQKNINKTKTKKKIRNKKKHKMGKKMFSYRLSCRQGLEYGEG